VKIVLAREYFLYVNQSIFTLAERRD